ncbi:MAG TPA: VOC family protein [Candidatus Dormibacteraeota bacterium]
MTKKMDVLVYPVKDLARAKALHGKLLGVEPYADTPYYVGFHAGDLQIGLDPRGKSNGPIAFWLTDDIEASLRELTDAGAELREAARDVGGGKLVATVTDPDGNVIGLAQNP